jgi:hypothetical protein
MSVLHLGHFAWRPARASGAFRVAEQFEQVTLIGMVFLRRWLKVLANAAGFCWLLS